MHHGVQQIIWLRSLRLFSIFMFFCSQWNKRGKGVDGKWNFTLFAAWGGENISGVIYLVGILFFFFFFDLIFHFLTKQLPHHSPGFARTAWLLTSSQCLWEAAGRLEMRFLPTALTLYSLKWPALTLCNLSGINCSENVYSLLLLECWRIKGLISFNA